MLLVEAYRIRENVDFECSKVLTKRVCRNRMAQRRGYVPVREIEVVIKSNYENFGIVYCAKNVINGTNLTLP
jgi:hypothetical protein